MKSIGSAQRTPVRCLFLLSILLLTALNLFYGHRQKLQQDPILFPMKSSAFTTTQVGNFSVHLHWHPLKRSDRFPSIEERVKLYMSNWYLPCNQSVKYSITYENETWPSIAIHDSSTNATNVFDSLLYYHHTFLLHRPTVRDCARTRDEYAKQGELFTHNRIRFRWAMQTYCTEAMSILNFMDQLDSNSKNSTTPVLAFFGDKNALQTQQIPVFAKFRAASTQFNIQQVTEEKSCNVSSRLPLKTAYYQDEYANKLSPIIWYLNTVRHWSTLPGALRKDVAWDQKMNRAFFGGDMTGWQNYTSLKTDYAKCQANTRCRFVYEHATSKWMDVRITSHLGLLQNDTIHGRQIVRPKVGVNVVQQHKIIISIEGNDVASGLKWSLQSASVVLMPPPTRTSWAMEELLQPWIHFIPMRPDGSNVEEMIQWVFDHDEEAQRIAERATLFIYDLVYHTDATSDDLQVKQEIVKRYRALWH